MVLSQASSPAAFVAQAYIFICRHKLWLPDGKKFNVKELAPKYDQFQAIYRELRPTAKLVSIKKAIARLGFRRKETKEGDIIYFHDPEFYVWQCPWTFSRDSPPNPDLVCPKPRQDEYLRKKVSSSSGKRRILAGLSESSPSDQHLGDSNSPNGSNNNTNNIGGEGCYETPEETYQRLGLALGSVPLSFFRRSSSSHSDDEDAQSDNGQGQGHGFHLNFSSNNMVSNTLINPSMGSSSSYGFPSSGSSLSPIKRDGLFPSPETSPSNAFSHGFLPYPSPPFSLSPAFYNASSASPPIEPSGSLPSLNLAPGQSSSSSSDPNAGYYFPQQRQPSPQLSSGMSFQFYQQQMPQQPNYQSVPVPSSFYDQQRSFLSLPIPGQFASAFQSFPQQSYSPPAQQQQQQMSSDASFMSTEHSLRPLSASPPGLLHQQQQQQQQQFSPTKVELRSSGEIPTFYSFSNTRLRSHTSDDEIGNFLAELDSIPL
eukprot:TRINITY_DN3184_c0_g1_i1.p1 TRINITY_DN3184_c0_g1~~TRINITY_DN3184_c0_g1_i1.p1  ORF type:complete len:483 (-),score=226.20 TRINITY_DN3184_c0_g1_i1:255-1703(-)